MTINNKKHVYRNLAIISIIAAILVTSGIGVAYADGSFSGKNKFGKVSGGDTNIANGTRSAAFGYGTLASEVNTVAFGFRTTASGSYTAAFGSNTIASGQDSAAFGSATNSTGTASTSFGASTETKPYLSFVIGRYNEIGGTTGSWVSTDPLFVIGNGDATTSNNAVTVLKNGKMGIGTSAPQSLLQLSGGYIQLDTVDSAPSLSDCADADHYGRVIADYKTRSLYVCADSGWYNNK